MTSLESVSTKTNSKLQIKIKRALLSVSDKTGIVPLALKLAEQGCALISTGGTKRVLEDAGLDVIDISTVTKNPEAFSGRMKTISFQVESAILFDREKDVDEAKALNIEPIDLVVCNLYPFGKVLEQGADFDTLIENIDIGGPTMIRAAAKNHRFVTVLTAPTEYEDFLKELDANQGATGYDFRKNRMKAAFNHTAEYDGLIASTLDEDSLHLSFSKAKPLRYGENSHQSARWYRQNNLSYSLADMQVLQGKAISYNNILDIAGAVDAVRDSENMAVSVVKHSNPCGLAEGDNQRNTLELAWSGDPISAFGSIIAFNRKVSLDTVRFFDLDNPNKSKRKFIEVLIAPDFDEDALAYLAQSKNLRVIRLDMDKLHRSNEYRVANGILLEQDPDELLFESIEPKTTKDIQIDANHSLIEFGIRAIKNIKSNAIALVGRKNGQLFLMGMGAGQPNRLIATKLAIDKATEWIINEFGEDIDVQAKLGEAILISDAFFPFADNVELAAARGVRYIIQPGGSIRDKSVIEACNNLGVAMAFTNVRHFKH